MAEVGKPLDPWQQLWATDALGLRPDGFWSAFEVVLLVSRQNGKGGGTEAIELSGLFLFGDQIIMHSAHLFKTSKQSFQRIVDIIDGSDWLSKRVKRVVRARGDEEIELTPKAGGGRLLYFSRSGGAGRGFTGDKTIFDEAAYLTIEQYQAATPTLATVPNPQIYYTGTPPDEDVGPMPDDAMMPSVRTRGHDGGDRIVLHEYSPPEKYDRSDPRLWAACNPALGIRIQEWFLAKQLENFTAAGKPKKFDTEHLGLWPDDPTKAWAVLPEADWSDVLDELGQPQDPVVFAIDTTPERSQSAIAVVGSRADGDLHGELVDHRPGTGWVVARAVDLVKRWRPAALIIDPAGAASGFIADLQTELCAGLTPLLPEITLMKARGVAQAYGMFHLAVKKHPDAELLAAAEEWAGPAKEPAEAEEPVKVRKLRVRERQPLALTKALAGAATRRIGDGTTWDRRSTDVDISPLVALTNALHGFLTLPEPEPPLPPPATASSVPEQRGGGFFRPTGRLNI